MKHEAHTTQTNLCEWDPERNRPAQGVPMTYGGRTVGYTKYTGCANRAAVIVGANGKWRLCLECAALPAFKRLRKKVLIGAGR